MERHPTDWDSCRRDLLALLEEETDEIARMASVAAVLYARMEAVSFCGFYRAIRPDTLVIGPYQGPVGCLRIAFGRGVCGAAAAEGRSILVPDVHAFPGHIACDPTARSELVVPVLGADGRVTAVLDLDSREPSRFSLADQRALEALLPLVFPGRDLSAR